MSGPVGAGAARTVPCWAADPVRQADLAAAVDELAERLVREYPAVTPIRAEVASDVAEDVLVDFLRSSLPGSRPSDRSNRGGLADRRTLAWLPPDHPFVAEAKRHTPSVEWGLAVPRRFAVVWHPNRLLWWHETLHLFGAKDCYNKFGVNKCPEPRCLMRCFSMREQDDGGLRLCGKNVRRIAAPPPPGEG